MIVENDPIYLKKNSTYTKNILIETRFLYCIWNFSIDLNNLLPKISY